MFERLRPLMPCGVLLASLLLTARYGLAPAAGRPVAAVFPPWWNPAETLARAAAVGSVQQLGAWPWIFLFRPGAADLAIRLRHAGAILVIDAGALGGCVSPVNR